MSVVLPGQCFEGGLLWVYVVYVGHHGGIYTCAEITDRCRGRRADDTSKFDTKVRGILSENSNDARRVASEDCGRRRLGHVTPENWNLPREGVQIEARRLAHIDHACIAPPR